VGQPRHRTSVLLLAFCLALVSASFFGYRAGRTARHIRWQNEPIQPWMSVPFVAHIHHTPAEPLFQAIHVPPNRRDRRPIRDIARAGKLPVSELIRDLQNAVANAGQPGAEAVPPSGGTPR
jgi:hypothetical protein